MGDQYPILKDVVVLPFNFSYSQLIPMGIKLPDGLFVKRCGIGDSVIEPQEIPLNVGPVFGKKRLFGPCAFAEDQGIANSQNTNNNASEGRNNIINIIMHTNNLNLHYKVLRGCRCGLAMT
jgi:hypothetical protein